MNSQKMTISEIKMSLMEKLRVEESFDLGWDQLDDWLYNSSLFQDINNDLPQCHFYLVQGHKILGHLSFSVESSIAFSHLRAPFGGFYCSSEVKSEEQLFFILEVSRRLKKMGLAEIRLHQAPSMMCKDVLSENLELLGYKRQNERVYQMIPISKDPFNDGIHSMEKRKLKKSIDMGFELEWVKDDHLKMLFDFILDQRQEKGFTFSMNWEMLKAYRKSFPDNYFGLCLRHNGKMIAGTILIKENSSVLYNFAPAHLAQYNRYSPLVFLTEAVYNWAQSEEFKYLNLGTSYVGDESNEGLFSFKEKLGAQSFIATTYQKVLNS